jgi:hypothetical protein
MTPKLEEEFSTLCGIVADVYRVPEGLIASKFRKNGIAKARIAAAAIWSETNTIHDTMRRLNYASTAAIPDARSRFAKCLHGEGVERARAMEVMRRVEAEIPQVLALYPNGNPLKMEEPPLKMEANP